MDQLSTIIDMVLNFDQYLPVLIAAYGFWTYAILFVIVFLETGIVVFPFLPGDSLLFVTGALAGNGLLNLEILLITLSIAAILGDTLNYWIGHYLGQKILDMKLSVIRQEHIDKTHFFFEKYGGFTIIIARFIPFVRTFAPFFAGLGRMNYAHFLAYNIIGGIAWVCAFVMAGYFFGNLPVVQDNFSLVIILIIGLSLIGVLSIILNMFKSFKIMDLFRRGKKD
jgi:membrane-associated protein